MKPRWLVAGLAMGGSAGQLIDADMVGPAIGIFIAGLIMVYTGLWGDDQ